MCLPIRVSSHEGGYNHWHCWVFNPPTIQTNGQHPFRPLFEDIRQPTDGRFGTFLHAGKSSSLLRWACSLARVCCFFPVSMLTVFLSIQMSMDLMKFWLVMMVLNTTLLLMFNIWQKGVTAIDQFPRHLLMLGYNWLPSNSLIEDLTNMLIGRNTCWVGAWVYKICFKQATNKK